PETVIDHATFEEPMRVSDGVRFVIVNGRLALRDGAPTGEQAGRPLARTAHMPTRPMPPPGRARGRVARRATIDRAAIGIDVAQDATANHASGTFRLEDPAANVSVEMKTFGVLQTAGDWASFTGRATVRRSEPERAIVVIVDGNTVVVDAGDYSMSGKTR